MTKSAGHQTSEKPLLESEGIFRILAEQSPNMIFINLNGKIVYANEKCEAVMGYTREEFYSPEFDFLSLIAPENRDLILANFKRHMKGEENPIVEYTLITKDGKKIEAILTTKLIEYEGERAILGTVTDITKYKDMLRALEDSKDKYKNVTDNCLNGIHIFQNGELKFVNETFLKFTGYTREELATIDYIDLVHPEDRETVVKQTEQAITGNLDGLSPEPEFRCVRKNGDVWWVQMKPCLIDYEGRPAILATSLDITERKRLEQDIQFQANLVDNVSDAIITTDTDFIITSWNKSAEVVYGFSVEEAIGEPVVDLTSLEYPYDSREDVLKFFFENGYWNGEVTQKRKDGSIVNILASVSSIKDTKGSLIGAVAVNRDITEYKQAQKKIRDLYDEEQKLRHQLEEELRKRTEFTRALVHELRTPLTPVIASSELMYRELKERKMKRLANNVYHGALNLNDRIEELLDLAKGEVDLLYLEPELIDPVAFLQDIIRDVRPIALKKGISLKKDIPVDLSMIRADGQRLRQVLLNLLDNAFKFCAYGSTVTLRSKIDSHNLIVEVEDTGIGITEQEKQYLFQPYYQLNKAKEHLTGLRIGLALSKKLIEMHGGQIWVESNEGKGSLFSFSVPLADIKNVK